MPYGSFCISRQKPMKIILTFSFCFGRGQHRKRHVASVVVAQSEATDQLCTAMTKKKRRTGPQVTE